MYEKYIKRIIDFTLSLFAFIVLLPVIAVVALLVRVKLGSPIIFEQKRPGKNEKIFTIKKFRTMTDERDEEGNLLPDEVRLTKFGKFLRSTSLDELPELINIIKGDMSIVGPRPLVPEYLPLYSEKQRHRHDARPGLTGYTAVMGRNAISWDKKFEYDLEYVENISFIFDCKIILMTVLSVLKREGINSEDSVTVEPFRGSQEEAVVEE